MELKGALENLRVFISKLKKQPEDNAAPETATFAEKFLEAEAFFSSEGLGGVLLLEEEGLEYQNLVTEVYLGVARHFKHAKNPDELHVSKKTIESAIQSAILKALDIPKQNAEPFETRLATCLTELKATLLNKPEPWLVHMEVRGMAPERLPYQFGEVEFYVSDGALKSSQQSSEPEIPAETTGETTGAPVSKTGFGSLFLPQKGAIYASIPVEATDTEAAKVLAERKLRLTVDALNFFSDFFDVLQSRVTLPGDAMVSDVKTLICSRVDPKKKHVSVGWTKPFLRFSFAHITDSSSRASGFGRVGSMLANASLSSLDERILSSLHWAGRASIENRREQSFLLFCISLEALLLGKRKNGEITQTFALRGAHLLVWDGARRREAFKDLKSLYGIRSSIVHSGHTQVTEADLSKIRWLAKTALLIMLVREPFSGMKTEEELEEWFEAQLLAGVECPPGSQNDSEQEVGKTVVS